MTKARKSTLALAVAAALGGGYSSSHAVNLATDGLGDVLIFPYYTTRNGWDTLFHITNTSSENTVALKVRFQEAHNSRDVLDFNVVLSPNDVWTGWVADTPSGPRFQSNDSTCTSPVKPAGGFRFSSLGYSTSNDDGGPTDLDRALEGHVSVIMMGHSDDDFYIDSDNFSVGGAAIEKDCAAVDKAFLRGANIDDTSDEFGEPINSLKGSFNLVRKESGISIGGEATTLANFFGGGLGTVDGDIGPEFGGFAGNYGVTNLITAQQFPEFLLPTLNDAVPSESWVTDSTAGVLQEAYLTSTWNNPVDAVSEVLMRNSVVNEWSNNPVNGVESYWVVTFPTKNHYVDPGLLPTPANLNSIGPPVVGEDYFVGFRAADPEDHIAGQPFSEIFSSNIPGQSCDEVTFTLYDRSEGSIIAGGTAVSPSPPVDANSLCYETNVIGFDPDDNLLMSNVVTAVDVSALVSGEPSGWMRLNLGNGMIGGEFNTADPVTQETGPGVFQGLPVVGFAFWTRDFGTPANNYGHLWDHSYTRAGGPTSVVPNGG